LRLLLPDVDAPGSGGGPPNDLRLKHPHQEQATAERADNARALEGSRHACAPLYRRGGNGNSGKSVPRAPARVKVRALHRRDRMSALRAGPCLVLAVSRRPAPRPTAETGAAAADLASPSHRRDRSPDRDRIAFESVGRAVSFSVPPTSLPIDRRRIPYRPALLLHRSFSGRSVDWGRERRSVCRVLRCTARIRLRILLTKAGTDFMTLFRRARGRGPATPELRLARRRPRMPSTGRTPRSSRSAAVRTRRRYAVDRKLMVGPDTRFGRGSSPYPAGADLAFTVQAVVGYRM